MRAAEFNDAYQVDMLVEILANQPLAKGATWDAAYNLQQCTARS